MRLRWKKCHGFTLIELMIALAVAAILMAAAMPSMSALVARNQLASASNEVVAHLNLARTEAVNRGRTAGICGSSDGFSCDGAWAQGYAVWVDTNRNDVVDAPDEIIRFAQVQADSVTLATDGAQVAFNARGRPTRAVTAWSITSAKCKPGKPLVNTIAVSTTGRVSQAKQNCGG